jgi:hypothetical protein
MVSIHPSFVPFDTTLVPRVTQDKPHDGHSTTESTHSTTGIDLRTP